MDGGEIKMNPRWSVRSGIPVEGLQTEGCNKGGEGQATGPLPLVIKHNQSIRNCQVNIIFKNHGDRFFWYRLYFYLYNFTQHFGSHTGKNDTSFKSLQKLWLVVFKNLALEVIQLLPKTFWNVLFSHVIFKFTNLATMLFNS